MKSLLLKDFYNMQIALRRQLVIYLIIAIPFIPLFGIGGYIISSTVMWGALISTSFAFDEHCKWESYALIMPISKRNIVISKYILALALAIFGTAFGCLIGSIGQSILQKNLISFESLKEILAFAFAGLMFSLFILGMAIPLVFKFGSHSSGIIFSVCSVTAALIIYLFGKTDFEIGTKTFFLAAPALIIIWNFIMYLISYSIYKKKDL